MNEIKLTIHPFKIGTEKESALKPLEEAAEVFGAWQGYDEVFHEAMTYDGPGIVYKTPKETKFADELADVIQASCNLAARYGIDLAAAMRRCEQRNRERGRYHNGDSCEVCGGSMGDIADHDGDDASRGGGAAASGDSDGGHVDCGANVRKVNKAPEKMSAEELIGLLRIVIPDTNYVKGLCFDSKWCDEFRECDDCGLRLLDLLKAAHEREVAVLEYEVSYHKAMREALERDYGNARKKITYLLNRVGELRDRIAEMDEAGIYDLYVTLKKALGEAKDATDTARHCIEKAAKEHDGHCGACGGDCGSGCHNSAAELAGEGVLSAEQTAQEVTEDDLPGTCPNGVRPSGVTDELRKMIDSRHVTYWSHPAAPTEEIRQYDTDGLALLAIADRIDEQFAKCCELWERTAADAAQQVHDSMEVECNKMADECEAMKRDAYRDADVIESLGGQLEDMTAERDALQSQLDELSVSGATELYKLLKSTLGEAKCAADRIQSNIDKIERTRRENDMYLAMLRDVARECRERGDGGR